MKFSKDRNYYKYLQSLFQLDRTSGEILTNLTIEW